MSRKRDDFEQKEHGRGPMTKRIKSPILLVDQLKVDHCNDDVISVNRQPPKYELDDDTFIRNNAIELTIISELPAQVRSPIIRKKQITRSLFDEYYAFSID